MSDASTNVHLDDDDEYGDDDYRGPGRMIAIAAVIAIALGVGGYFAGHANAKGPTTLAEAVQQAQQGKLACGTATATATPAAGQPPTGAQGSAFLLRSVCNRGATAPNGAAGGGLGGARRGFGGGVGGVTGTVQSVTGSTLTIQSPRTGTLKLKLSSSTKVSKSSAGSLSDLKPGASVSVSGTGQGNTNPATSIFILPTAQ